MRLGKSREAVDAARHAVALVPDNAGLKANLGLALLVHGDVEEALRTTKAALSAAPDDPITKNLLGLIEDVRDGKRPRPTRWPED